MVDVDILLEAGKGMLDELTKLTAERDSWKRRAVEAESRIEGLLETHRQAARVICDMGCSDDPRGADDEDPLTDVERRVLRHIARRRCSTTEGLRYVHRLTGDANEAILSNLEREGLIGRDKDLSYMKPAGNIVAAYQPTTPKETR